MVAWRKVRGAGRGLSWVLAVLGAMVLPTREARAGEHSAYEAETLQEVLGERLSEVDPAPEGKRIEDVEIVVLDVIEERDPLPDFLNWLHTNTRPYIVTRELLFSRGEPYRASAVQQTQRNLRGLRQLSVVLSVPLRGTTPDAVRVVLIVKDVWSLRLNTDFRIKAGKLEYLFLQPAEENLAGTHRKVLAAFELRPDTLGFGGRVVDPHLAGTRHQLALDANGVVNRETGGAEGSSGYFQLELPLYSEDQEWAWGTLLSWRKEVTRRYVGLELATYDAAATPQDDAIPWAYGTDLISGRISATRSFGAGLKHDLTFGWQVKRSLYDAGDLSAFPPEAAAEFLERRVPVSDVRVGPSLLYHVHPTSYASLLDAETLGLQEDYRLGPELYVGLQPSARFIGATRDLVNLYAHAAFTALPHRSLVRVYAAAATDFALTGDDLVPSAEVQAGVRIVSPPFGFARLVYDGTFHFRPKNYLHQRLSLGGDGRLRGYPSAFFTGADLLASNLELRTLPVQIWTFQLAASAFYDVADAFDGLSDLHPKQGAGFGLRVLLPQVGRAVLRLDWGFPLTPDETSGSVFDGLVLTFQQAFGMPNLDGSGVNIAPR